jgi:hypothetical protein
VNRRSEQLIFAIIAVSTPAALGVEALVRRFLLPPVVEELREWLHPKVAPVGWALVGLAVVAIPLAFALHRRLFAFSLAHKPASMPEVERTDRSRLETLLLTTSIAQTPALLVTMAYTFGADPLSAQLTIALGTLGVLVQWPALRRLGS